MLGPWTQTNNKKRETVSSSKSGWLMLESKIGYNVCVSVEELITLTVEDSVKALVVLLRYLIGFIGFSQEKKNDENFVKEMGILHRESWEMSSEGD